MKSKVSRLREDWLKLGDDFISDKLVKIDQEVTSDLPPSRSSYVEGYINGEFDLCIWFNAAFGDSAPCEFRAILYDAPSSDTGRLLQVITSQGDTMIHAAHQVGSPMFVGIPQSVEDVDGMPVR